MFGKNGDKSLPLGMITLFAGTMALGFSYGGILLIAGEMVPTHEVSYVATLASVLCGLGITEVAMALWYLCHDSGKPIS